MNERYETLVKEAHKIKSEANRWAVQNIIYSADDNAGQSISDDKDRTAADYDWIFAGSIGSILSTGEHSAQICKWFETRGISY